MKKYLIGILMMGVFLFVLCGCGGSPLEQANKSLTELADKPVEERAAGEVAFNVQYNAEQDVLQIDLENGADLEPIFEALYQAIDGKEIGTLIFTLDGTKGNGYEKDLVEKIGALPCTSMERLGLNYHILDYEQHDWLAIADKTDKLYLVTPISTLGEYRDKDLEDLGKFKDVQVVYSPSMDWYCIDALSGAETLSLVSGYVFNQTETSEDPLDKVTEDNPYLESADSTGNVTAETTAEATAETAAGETGEAAEEEAVNLTEFDYYTYTARGLENFANMKSLKTLLIYPETGYSMTPGGESFIKAMQLIKPDLQVNPPGTPGTEELVAVTDVETLNVTEDTATALLKDFLDNDLEKVYKKCIKYKEKGGDAVLTGKCLIFQAEPPMESWSDKRKFTSSGNILLTEAAKKDIKVPETMGDYKTFVYIYPTYTRTGVYTSGTKAYSQNLHVQVFDMENKIAYEAESVGTAAAPQSFSYFAGSVPDKHSGEVDIDKALNYLKKLKKQ